ncbi:MAG: hypothetical protein QXW81_00840, partial [Archaeoglobaceae archaeon]
EDPKECDPWLVWSLSNGIVKEISEVLKIQHNGIQCELGYYHHRIIFKIKIFKLHLQDGEFKVLREIRDNLHRTVRELLNKALVNKEIKSDGKNPKYRISYVYTYPLIIIYDGVKLIKEKRKDRIFSISTTTFFFKIPEVKYRILLRSHFIRISIPCTIVYADKELSNSIFWEVVNGIYYAALYSKKLQDLKSQISTQGDDALNKLDEGILRELSSYLNKGVVTLEIQEAENRVAWIALIISVMSILVSTIIPFISKIIGLIG